MTLYRRIALGLALALAVVVLAGCVDSDAPPRAHMVGGVVSLSASATAADESPQWLDEYGVFYSRSRDDIVAVNGYPYKNNLSSDEDFVVRDGVTRVSITATEQIAAKETGTLLAEMPALPANTTMYYRFYTVGRDSVGSVWKFALQVGQVSSDATLRSIKMSAGKLTPGFSRTKPSYSVAVPAKTSKVKVSVACNVSGSVVNMRSGSGAWRRVGSLTVSLKRGKSVVVAVKVVATDGASSRTYSIKLKRK